MLKPEEDVDAGDKGPCILQRKVAKAIQEVRVEKVTNDADVHGDVLRLLGRRRSETNETADQQHMLNWRVAQGFY
jgi:hypothetical protein